MAVKSFITLAPGGSTGLMYNLKLLYNENYKFDNNPATAEAREK